MEKKSFGFLPDKREAYLYRIKNSKGMWAEISDFGALITKLVVPDDKGNMIDVALGYDRLEDYMFNEPAFGATILPSAGRIAGAEFTLEGKTYELEKGEDGNNLHSSFANGSHKRLWKVEDSGDNFISLCIEMKDGDLGFPGNRVFHITFSIGEDNSISLKYSADSDRNTVINLTNHNYFNLSGHDSGPITDHILTLNSSEFTEVREDTVPTGRLLSVEGTPMDFRGGRRVGDDIDSAYEQLRRTKGYDHCFVVDGYREGELSSFGEVTDPESGIIMEVITDLPGCVIYAGNYIKEHTGKGGITYNMRHGICFESGHFPNAINTPAFKQPVYGPGKPFASETIYRFYTKERS